MPDWFERIATIISEDENETAVKESVARRPNLLTATRISVPPLKETIKRTNASLPGSQIPKPSDPQASSIPATTLPSSPASSMPDFKDEKTTMKNKTATEDNLKALKRLRELPRGTQVESRIAAIKNLLGEHEIFKTLQMLRWPQGVICPRCHSTNVVRRDPPADAPDQRHYYVCLNCKGEGSPSGFDDFTGLPIKSLYALRQWIMCWYLIGFCSVTQIARVLGISINEVIQIATLGAQLTELPEAGEELRADETHLFKTSAKRTHQRKKEEVEKQEQDNRSQSKSWAKPGYKSKK